MKIIIAGTAFISSLSGLIFFTNVNVSPFDDAAVAQASVKVGTGYQAIDSEKNDEFSAPNKEQLLPVLRMQPIYAGDFSNDKILVGASHNIFIGRVLTETGQKGRSIGPETQFSVEVTDNIKGELGGVVTVNQQGGYKNGKFYIVGETEAESYLLKPGATYIFATRYNEKEDWYTLNSHPNASKLLAADSKDAIWIQELITSDQRIQELRAAYPNEILIKADVINGKSHNSFESKRAEKIDERSNVNDVKEYASRTASGTEIGTPMDSDGENSTDPSTVIP